MTSTENPLATLQQELNNWRAEIAQNHNQNYSGSPAGKELHELNLAWGEARMEYKAKAAALMEKIAQERGTPVSRPRGRPKNPDYSDEVKVAAYRCSQTLSKSVVRMVMGISDTEKLNRVLQQGKDLHERNDW